MGVKVPTLSMQNWLDDVRLKMNKLFEHFMASDFSQSTLTPRRISSLKYCMASPGSITKIREDITSALSSLYMSYFDTVNVNVDVKETDTLVTFSIEIDVIENRSVNNLMVTILKKFIEENKEKYSDKIKSI